jgi:hypothetical protein
VRRRVFGLFTLQHYGHDARSKMFS